MKRLLCPQLPKPHRPVTLPETEANHAVRVLRLEDGDTVEALDGQGHAMPVTLRVGPDGVRLEFLAAGSTNVSSENATTPVDLEMAVIKGDAMEWVIEKAVELGIRKVVPLQTDHCVVQFKNKGPEAFQERWQKIADQALKQCGRLQRLEIALPLALREYLTQTPSTSAAPRFWCDESARTAQPDSWKDLEAAFPSAQSTRLLIGPEGGWSEAERKLLRSSNCLPLSLGPLVLRAETAAIAGCVLLSARWRRV